MIDKNQKPKMDEPSNNDSFEKNVDLGEGLKRKNADLNFLGGSLFNQKPEEQKEKEEVFSKPTIKPSPTGFSFGGDFKKPEP